MLHPSALAFFPMVPALIRVVRLVTFLPFPYSGVVVSWSMAAIAAVGVHTLARSLFGRRAGYACVGLWACSPYAFALWVPYSEATFTAFLMWTLIAVVARRWLWAGVLCALAGTVRPTSAVLVAVVAVSAIRAVTLRRGGWRPWAAVGLAPLPLRERGDLRQLVRVRIAGSLQAPALIPARARRRRGAAPALPASGGGKDCVLPGEWSAGRPVTIYTAEPGSPSEKALRHLASWTAAQEADPITHQASGWLLTHVSPTSGLPRTGGDAVVVGRPGRTHGARSRPEVGVRNRPGSPGLDAR
ncbi:hypothetical protein [Streptomyces sp. NPDC059489]|uniref:hypothetical protein n=1 Tax=Streptomyces sp. NPDC059489 TaxID=3346849 RepID=UPI003695446A